MTACCTKGSLEKVIVALKPKYFECKGYCKSKGCALCGEQGSKQSLLHLKAESEIEHLSGPTLHVIFRMRFG